MPDSISEVNVLRAAIDLIRARLPHGWELARTAANDVAATDGSMVLSAPDGRSVHLIAEVKTGSPSGRHALGVAQELHERAASERGVPLLIARYLAPPVREQLQRVGVSYVDSTGNIMLSAIEPGLYLADRGSDRDPWRTTGRPRGTLKGDPAARVVRALLDYSRSWKVRDLISESRASTGATYRVLEYLDGEGLADRGEDGLWSVPSWERLLRAWAEDFDFFKANTVTRYIDARGIENFLGSLREDGDAYAVTGAIASRDWTGIAPTRSVFAYAMNTERQAKDWGVRPTEAGANIVLLEPPKAGSVIFDRTGALADGIRRVAPAQVAVDLLNGPGRDPQEAEELLRWMRENEKDWRLA